MKLEIEIFAADKKSPEVSGDYLVYVPGSLEWVMTSYSVKHKAFNALDGQTAAEALKTRLKVTHWGELPRL